MYSHFTDTIYTNTFGASKHIGHMKGNRFAIGNLFGIIDFLNYTSDADHILLTGL